MIYGYIRVSTDKQTLLNQRFELKQFCLKNNIKIDKWIEEIVSSKKNLKNRKLGLLIDKLKKNDILIASELSRLGRNLFQIVSILNQCLNKECQVWTIKDNYRLGQDIHSKVLAFIFGLAAEVERDLISARTKEALHRIQKEGRLLGRPKGQKSVYSKLDKHKAEIERLLNLNIPKNKIAKKLHVDIKTLNRFIRIQSQKNAL